MDRSKEVDQQRIGYLVLPIWRLTEAQDKNGRSNIRSLQPLRYRARSLYRLKPIGNPPVSGRSAWGTIAINMRGQLRLPLCQEVVLIIAPPIDARIKNGADVRN